MRSMRDAKMADLQMAIDILHDFNKENNTDRSVGIFGDEEMAFAIPLAIAALKEKIQRRNDALDFFSGQPKQTDRTDKKQDD